jgi:hypothetical protein
MVDVDGVMSVVMKGGGKLASGDDNLFALLRKTIVHDQNTEDTRREDKKRKMEYYQELVTLDEEKRAGIFVDAVSSLDQERTSTNWRTIRRSKKRGRKYYQKMWDKMLDVYNRTFYRKLAKIGSKFYKDQVNLENKFKNQEMLKRYFHGRWR